jgi:hypothetical protein
MAHFAELDDNNLVQQVIVVENEHAPTEEAGLEYIKDVLKLDGTWIQTSYNGNIRGKFAGIMDIYDSKKDKFINNEKYNEEKQKLQLEKQKELEIELAKKEAIASKIGLTVEELQAILKQ